MPSFSTEQHIELAHSRDLDERQSLRFELEVKGGHILPCFMVRKDGVVHGFVNRCMHWPVSLDTETGDFWDYDEQYLQCKVHGALYELSGLCIAGPCTGDRLVKLPVFEDGGKIFLDPELLPSNIDEA